MLILGLQGSPRKKGNTRHLISAFLCEAKERYGARTLLVDVDEKDIRPCKEYIVCEKKGFCPIDDAMKHEIYPLLREADIVVAASPVFFYNVTAQLKALIDRSQTLWARKYRLRLADPKSRQRRGFMLAVGATGGKSLFEGIHLTMKYFFDAVDADYNGSLTYRKIESAGDMARLPGISADVSRAVASLCEPLAGRKKILFLGNMNDQRSQMAAAFAQYMAGEKVDVSCAGTMPAATIDPLTVKSMAAKGIDMAFRNPVHVERVLADFTPQTIVTLGGPEADFAGLPDVERLRWRLPERKERTPDSMDDLRDEIQRNVAAFMDMI